MAVVRWRWGPGICVLIRSPDVWNMSFIFCILKHTGDPAYPGRGCQILETLNNLFTGYFSNSNQPRAHISIIFSIRCLHSGALSPCPNHPRTRQQATRDRPSYPELWNYSNLPTPNLLIVPASFFLYKPQCRLFPRLSLSLPQHDWFWCFPVWFPQTTACVLLLGTVSYQLSFLCNCFLICWPLYLTFSVYFKTPGDLCTH